MSLENRRVFPAPERGGIWIDRAISEDKFLVNLDGRPNEVRLICFSMVNFPIESLSPLVI